MSKADDMKNTHFKPFTDDTSGPEGERAVRDLKQHGNIPDAYAETFTDCMLGCDMGRGQLPLHCAGYLGLHRWLTETVNEIDAAGNVAAPVVPAGGGPAVIPQITRREAQTIFPAGNYMTAAELALDAKTQYQSAAEAARNLAGAANAGERNAILAARKELRQEQNARVARMKKTAAYIMKHFVEGCRALRIFAEPTNVNGVMVEWCNDGQMVFDWIVENMVRKIDESQIIVLQTQWRSTTFDKHIGFHATMVRDMKSHQDAINIKLPAANQFTDDDLAKHILNCLVQESNLSAGEARRELNAVEGVPGAVGVREFQLLPNAARAFDTVT